MLLRQSEQQTSVNQCVSVMARLWQIRESYGDRMSKEDMSVEEREAYDCGYDEGYADAMEEVGSSDMGERYGMRGGRMGNRYPEMGERRRRRSNGRYM